jgi:hypothetical protein
LKSLFFLLVFGSIVASGMGSGSSQAWGRNPCEPQRPMDQVIYNSDFKWDYELAEMIDLSVVMYSSLKRLDRRAFFDTKKNKYFLPFDKERGGQVELPESFINSITQHIEKAFQRQFIDAVFFPDMGHSHILIPEVKYRAEYSAIPTSSMNLLYEKIFNDPEIKVVYHTAEQLKSLDENRQPLPDKKVQWRFYTRNLVGDNQGEKKIEIYNALDESRANTLGGVAGFYWWGAGFSISANQNGCFSYKRDGKMFNYDISLYDLPMDPAEPTEIDP